MDCQEFRSPNYRKTIADAYSCNWISESAAAEHLWLRFLYESHRKGSWYLLRKNFPCLLVECMTEGVLGHEVGDRKFLSGAGEVIVIPQVPWFRFFSPSPAESKRFAFEVQGSLVPVLGERFGLSGPVVFRTERMELYRSLYDRCLELFRAKRAGTETEVSSLCFRLLEMLGEEARPFPERRLQSRLNPVLEYVQRHPDADLSCTALARHFGCSTPTLNRLFRSVLGESPQNYVLRYRMSQADHLLRTGEDSVKEISGRLGFRNPFYFTRVFRGYFGVTPSAVRRGFPAGEEEKEIR